MSIMQRFAWVLNVDIQENVYLRRDGFIVEARYIGYICTPYKTEHHFLLPTKDEIEKVSVSTSNLDSWEKLVYKSIENAIEGVPMKYQLLDLTDILKKHLGFTHNTNWHGATRLVLPMYRWDGYKVIKCDVHHSEINIHFDGVYEWHFRDDKNNSEFFETYAECADKHGVKIILFPR